jgi:hypothetical protein
MICSSVSTPNSARYPLGPIDVAVTLVAETVLVAAALTRAAFTVAGWRPPPLSPVVVRPFALTITGFAVNVISRATGVTMAFMVVLPALARCFFLLQFSIRDGLFNEDASQSLARI